MGTCFCRGDDEGIWQCTSNRQDAAGGSGSHWGISAASHSGARQQPGQSIPILRIQAERSIWRAAFSLPTLKPACDIFWHERRRPAGAEAFMVRKVVCHSIMGKSSSAFQLSFTHRQHQARLVSNVKQSCQSQHPCAFITAGAHCQHALSNESCLARHMQAASSPVEHKQSCLLLKLTVVALALTRRCQA